MNMRGWSAGIAVVLLVAAGACGEDPETSTSAFDTTATTSATASEEFTGTGQMSVADPWIWIRRTSDLDSLYAYTVLDLPAVDRASANQSTWTQLLDTTVDPDYRGRTGLKVEGEVSVGGVGIEVGTDCSRWVMLFLADSAEGYREVLRVHPNFCGVLGGEPSIEVGPDRVVTSERHHEADFAGVEGAVVVNGPGQHGVAPDQSVPVVMDESFRDQVLDHICVDVTVRSGAGGPDGTVGARIELLADGVPIEILYYRADETAERVPLVEQKPHSVVMYPMGSVRTSEGVPDTLRVDTTAGIIESWEATARGCGSGGSRL